MEKKTYSGSSRRRGLSASEIREKFAQEYLVDLNISAAGRRAGYKGKAYAQTAWKAFQHPEVQKIIQREMDKRSRRTGIEADAVLRDIRKVADICMGRLPSPETGTIIFDPSGANKSLENLGKHLKLFVERHEVDMNLRLAGMSDEELLRMLEELREQTGANK